MAATLDTHKACTKCFQIKALEEFHKNPTGQYGRSSWCAKCHLDHQRRYKARQRAERVEAASEDGQTEEARRGHRIAWRTEEGVERDSRAQEVALLGADLSRLRKALNEWWQESGEGQQAECGTTWLAARVILRAAAEKDRAIQKRRSR